MRSLMLGALACSASEIEVARVVELEVTREIEVPVEVIREVEVTREIEVIREIEVEVTRVVEVPVEVTRVLEGTSEVARGIKVAREAKVANEVAAVDTQSSSLNTEKQELSTGNMPENAVPNDAQDALGTDERGRAIIDFWWRNVWEAYPEIIFRPDEPRHLEPAHDWAGELTLHSDGTNFEPYEVWVGKSEGGWYRSKFLPLLLDQLNSFYFMAEYDQLQSDGAQEFMLNELNTMFSIFKEYTGGQESYAWTPPSLGNMIWVHTVGWIEHDPDSANCDDWVATARDWVEGKIKNICHQGSVFTLVAETGDLTLVQGNAVYAIDETKFIPDAGPGYPYRDDYVYK